MCLFNKKYKDKIESLSLELNQKKEYNSKLESKIKYLESEIDRLNDSNRQEIKIYQSNNKCIEKFSNGLNIDNYDSIYDIYEKLFFGIEIPNKSTIDENKYTYVCEDNEWLHNLFCDWALKLNHINYLIEIWNPIPFKDFINYIDAVDVIQRYCGYEYKQMNSLLRQMYDDYYSYSLKNYQLQCNNLSYHFFNAPILDKNIIVYRFLDLVSFRLIIQNLVDGCGNYTEKAFISTSLCDHIDDEGVTEPYSETFCAIKLFIPKGYSAMYTSYIAGRESENELLLPNDSTIKAVSNPYYDKIKKMIFIDCVYENKVFNESELEYN